MQKQASRKKHDVFYILIIHDFAYCKIKVQIPAGKRDYINRSIFMTKCKKCALSSSLFFWCKQFMTAFEMIEICVAKK
jgi:hypothetical protein